GGDGDHADGGARGALLGAGGGQEGAPDGDDGDTRSTVPCQRSRWAPRVSCHRCVVAAREPVTRVRDEGPSAPGAGSEGLGTVSLPPGNAEGRRPALSCGSAAFTGWS